MASFVTRTEQKLKEWWGAPITKDPKLEEKKSKLNEIDQYIKALSQSYSSISLLFQQMQGHLLTIATATQKLFEKETDTNKRIGIEVSAMFGNLSELFRSKVVSARDLNKNFNDWFQTIETLKVQLKYFDEVRLVFDHYKAKVDELNTDHNNLLQKGANENFKLVEKLRRNQSKLSNAENSYNAKLSEILNNMNKLLFGYYKMINSSLDQFIVIDFDLTMNEKSILKKHQKAFNKFKYPDQEPIIDLVRGAQEIVQDAQDQVNKKVEAIIAAKEEAKQSADTKEKKVDHQHKQQDTSGTKQGQWDQFNPFNQQPQQQQQSNSAIEFFSEDDTKFQMQQDYMRQQQQQQQQQQQFNINRGYQSAFVPQVNNPFSESQQMQPSQRQSMVQSIPMSPFDDPSFMSQNQYRQQSFQQQSNYNPYQQQQQQQQQFQQRQQDFPMFEQSPNRAQFDNPYTYSQSLLDMDYQQQQQRQSQQMNRNTNPFM